MTDKGLLVFFCFGHVEADLEERAALCFFMLPSAVQEISIFFCIFFFFVLISFHIFYISHLLSISHNLYRNIPPQKTYIYIYRVYIQVYDLHAFRMVFVLSNIVSNCYIYMNI